MRPGLGEQRVVGGGDVLRDGAGLLPRERGGHRDGGALVHDEPLGLPAAGQHRHHPIADREAGGAGPEGDHLAGRLEAGDVDRRARRRRVEAGALEEVGVADAGGPHRHRDLARARLRVRVLPPLERAIDDRDRVHGAARYRWPMGDVVADRRAGVELPGPGDPLVLLEQLHPVGQPPGGARDGEEHGEHLHREAHRLVDEPE